MDYIHCNISDASIQRSMFDEILDNRVMKLVVMRIEKGFIEKGFIEK